MNNTKSLNIETIENELKFLPGIWILNGTNYRWERSFRQFREFPHPLRFPSECFFAPWKSSANDRRFLLKRAGVGVNGECSALLKISKGFPITSFPSLSLNSSAVLFASSERAELRARVWVWKFHLNFPSFVRASEWDLRFWSFFYWDADNEFEGSARFYE